MATTIDMVHPGPVRLIRRGGRKETVALVPVRTRIELREVDPREIPRVGALSSAGEVHVYHAHAGQAWLQVRGSRFGKLPISGDPATFKRFLEDVLPAAHYAHTDFVRALAGGPVLGSLVRHVRRDDSEDLARARTVIDDAREEASRSAKLWAEERILLSDGKVFIRATSPMAVLGTGGSYGSLQRCLVEPFAAHWRTHEFKAPDPSELALELHGYPIRPDRIADLQAVVEQRRFIEDPERQHDLVRSQLTPESIGLLDDDDIALMANVLPGVAVGEIERYLRAGVAWDGQDEAEAVLTELKRLETRGAVGMISIEEAEPVVTRLAAVARSAPGVSFQAMAMWADAVALPRLRARFAKEAPAEDAEILSSLAHG